MRWIPFIDICTPLVFSPKVAPDPASAERLDEKFAQAMVKLKNSGIRSPSTVPATYR